MLVIGKTTPHVFMWFCDGTKIPEGMLPLPSAPHNYYEILQIECEKLQKTDTIAYLFYMGKLLNNEQKSSMEALSFKEGLENLGSVACGSEG